MTEQIEYFIGNPDFPTPVQKRGDVWVKRDDLFSVAGVRGGKVRTCLYLAKQSDKEGLVTAGSRSSPQVNIVAHIAKHLGKKCRVHIPTGEIGPEIISAREQGAEIVQHRPGYNSVIIARAKQDALLSNWTEIPFGMECQEAVEMTRKQIYNLPFGDFNRLVVSAGSGMSLAGILWGLKDMAEMGAMCNVIAVRVGADPVKRLNKYAPPNWRNQVTFENSNMGYDDHAPTNWNGLVLDPHYEAKVVPFIKKDDLFWIVGRREMI